MTNNDSTAADSVEKKRAAAASAASRTVSASSAADEKHPAQEDGEAIDSTTASGKAAATQSPSAQSPDEFPSDGVLLGIDYGTKRVGYAVSDATQFIAGPLDNYTRRTRELDAQHLQQIVREYQVAGLVVGLPVHLSGDEGGKEHGLARPARPYPERADQADERPGLRRGLRL